MYLDTSIRPSLQLSCVVRQAFGEEGASDCSCVAHLFYFEQILRDAYFKEILFLRNPDHGPIRKAAGGFLADSLR